MSVGTLNKLEPRPIAIIGAPSSIGIRPYDNGEPRRLDLAPGTLRELGLVARLGADDLGDVTPPPYRDFVRPPGRPRNEDLVEGYSRELADRVARGIGDGRFTLVLGGDCSIVLGCLLGAGRETRRIGLAYVDGHADFATPQESMTGSAASMCLALAVGRGDSSLAELGGPRPLVGTSDVTVIGRRDGDEPGYGNPALAASDILDLPDAVLSERGGAAVAAAALERLGQPDMDGFWIHLDADVINPDVMPAVDSPEPGGPGIEEMAALIGPLAAHPRALGMHLTIYDPALDPDRACGRRLVDLLGRALGGPPTGGGNT